MRRRTQFLILSISILVLLANLPAYIQAEDSIYFYEPYPQGTIGISNPEIGWKFILQDNKVESVNFYLNGEPIDVFYDRDRQVFYSIPKKKLSGTNKVEARIKLKNWSNLIKYTWYFTVASNSVSSLQTPNPQQITAINYANDYRYVLGNTTYTFANSLNMSAQKHAEYQAINNVFGHYQTKDIPGYFGTTITNRANYYGFFWDVAEDISYETNASIQDAVDSLFDAPYHRIPFLIPSYNYFGYGNKNDYHVVNFGRTIEKEPKWVAYPAPNQKDIPISWENYESPNPLRFYNNSNRKVGYPIVVGVYGKDVEGVTLKYASLTDENNNEVPIYVNSPKKTGGNDDELNNEVFLIPKYPLKTSEKYKVRVIFEAKLKEGTYYYNRTWYFTTERSEGSGKNSVHQQVKYPPETKYAKNIKFRIGQKYMIVDNLSYPLDATPYIENGRTMVPIRALGNSLGADIDWNSSTRTVIYKKGDTLIELPVNLDIAKVNGETISLDQGAVIKNNRSYVPIRFVSEQLGAGVNWSEEQQEVIIKP